MSRNDGQRLQDILERADRIAHHYHRVEPEIVWETCAVRVPGLSGAIRKALDAQA